MYSRTSIKKSAIQVPLLGILTGLLYNVWPLGYLLNTKTARTGVISDLEAIGQPFNWFFIGCDLITGILAVILLLFLVRIPHKKSKSLWLLTAGISAFAFGTFTSAGLPLRCSADLALCGIQTNQIFSAHDVLSTIAVFGVILAVIGTVTHSRSLGRHTSQLVSLLVVTSFWAISGLLFLITSLRFHAAVFDQQVFVVLTGFVIASVAYECYRSNRI